MEGLVSKNSKEKVELLKEYVKEDNVILMNLTDLVGRNSWRNSGCGGV